MDPEEQLKKYINKNPFPTKTIILSKLHARNDDTAELLYPIIMEETNKNYDILKNIYDCSLHIDTVHNLFNQFVKENKFINKQDFYDVVKAFMSIIFFDSPLKNIEDSGINILLCERYKKIINLLYEINLK